MGIQKPSHTLAKIHLKALRTKSLHILFTLSFTMFINMFCLAQELPKPKEPIKPITKNDTVVKDTTVVSIGKLLDAPKRNSLQVLSIIQPKITCDLINEKTQQPYTIKQKLIMVT